MDDNDDWLISSLERYEQLFMYDLSTPVYLMHLSHNNEGVWVYGQSSGHKRELLFLTLPGKITDEGITEGRDFKMTKGAIVPYSINTFQELKNQQIVVSNNENRSLHWWQEDINNPDLLLESSSVTLKDQERSISYMDWMCDSEYQLLLGTHKPGVIQLYDMSSNTVVWENMLGVELHGLHYYNDNQYLIISCQDDNGNIQINDIRMEPSYNKDNSNKIESYPQFTLSSSTSHITGTLSNHGHIQLYDIRKSSNDSFYSLTLPVTLSDNTMCLTISPDATTLGLSGLVSGVRIYSTTNNSEPVFTHDGHEKEGGSMTIRVQTHLWNPNATRLLLSAANDGSLHAWQYNEYL